MCNEDKCNGKDETDETDAKVVKSDMTFENGAGKFGIITKPTGSTGSSESPRCSGIKNCKETFFMNLIIFKN